MSHAVLVDPDVALEGPDSMLTVFPAPAHWATRGEHSLHALDAVAEPLRSPELWPGEGTPSTSHYRLPAWTFARFRDNARVVMRDNTLADALSAERVEDVHGLWIEYEDEPSVSAELLHAWWRGYGFVAYTTVWHNRAHGERPVGPRWRLSIAFSRPVSPEVAQRVARWARHPRHAVGMVAASTGEVHRIVEKPAMAPGGYQWTALRGAALDPRVALKQLAEWERLDVQREAIEALKGMDIGTVAGRFRWRHRAAVRHPTFALPGGIPAPDRERVLALSDPQNALPALSSMVEGLWPGRMGAVLGASGSGRTALALSFALAGADQGHPVLLVLLRMSGDDFMARLLSAYSGVRAADLLRGACTVASVEAATETLRAQYASLHIWVPSAEERTNTALTERIAAVSQVHNGRAPLVVVDSAAGWGSQGGLVDALRDISHPGSLTQNWPGAAAWLVGDLPTSSDLLLGDTASLRAAFDSNRLVEVQRGDLQGECALVLVIAKEKAPDGGATDALVAVAKNREGRTGLVPLRFESGTGRFREVD